MNKETEAKAVRPAFCTDEHLDYLDDLRESGETNMFAAARYLEGEFPELAEGTREYRSSDKSKDVLLYWMKSFSERHPPKTA